MEVWPRLDGYCGRIGADCVPSEREIASAGYAEQKVGSNRALNRFAGIRRSCGIVRENALLRLTRRNAGVQSLFRAVQGSSECASSLSCLPW
jgi:hypothetical protein